jgi:hypothetical protein
MDALRSLLAAATYKFVFDECEAKEEDAAPAKEADAEESA